MNASLDTDIIIHLYKSGKKELLFEFFDDLYIHEFLLENEVRTNSEQVYTELLEDIKAKSIQVITTNDLISRGIKNLFDDYVKEYACLFDRGELRAIALAKLLGIAAFVSDDTKNGGPHQLLVNEYIEAIIPFAFYELLFLKYLQSELTAKQYYDSFKQITDTSMSERPMNFNSKIKATVRRFTKGGSERDLKWRDDFCNKQSINLKQRMQELKQFLNNFKD